MPDQPESLSDIYKRAAQTLADNIASDPNVAARDLRNPGRRYKEFRPRLARRGQLGFTAVNLSTISLVNSTNSRVLVVRAWTVWTSVAHMVFVGRQASSQAVGTAAGQISAVVAGDSPGAGGLYQLDTATQINQIDYMVPTPSNLQAWGYDFPFDVILPGWALTFQDSVAAELMRLAIMWEELTIDQLDYTYAPE